MPKRLHTPSQSHINSLVYPKSAPALLLVKTRNSLHVFPRSTSQRATGTFATLRMTRSALVGRGSRACRPQTASGLLEELHAILPRQPLQSTVCEHGKHPDKSKFAPNTPSIANPLCLKVFERGLRGKLFLKSFPLTHP